MADSEMRHMENQTAGISKVRPKTYSCTHPTIIQQHRGAKKVCTVTVNSTSNALLSPL